MTETKLNITAVLMLLLGLTMPAEAVISRTGQAYGRYGSGNTTIDSASFPGTQLGPNGTTGYFGVTAPTIDTGGQGQITESIGVLSAASGFHASSNHPTDPLNYFIVAGGGATLIHTIDVTSGTLPQFTPVQVKFKLGVAHQIDATHTFGTPGSGSNNAIALASVQANVTGLCNTFLGSNDNKAVKSTLDGTDIAVGLFSGSMETEFIINSEVGGTITFALVVDADANGDVSGVPDPLENRTAHAYATVAVAYGAGPANGEDIQLSVTGPSASFPGLQNATHAHALANLLNNPFAPLQGDLDGDGFVGINDLNIILGNWNQNVTAGDPLSGDPSGDGFVGIDDLNQVLSNWNAGSPPNETANIPEPASLGLMGLCLLGLSRRR